MIVLVLAVIVLISYGIIGKIVTEAMEFVKDFPTYMESIKADYTEIPENMNELIDKLPKGISKQVDSFTDGLGDIGAKLVKGISAPTFGALGAGCIPCSIYSDRNYFWIFGVLFLYCGSGNYLWMDWKAYSAGYKRKRYTCIWRSEKRSWRLF